MEPHTSTEPDTETGAPAERALFPFEEGAPTGRAPVFHHVAPEHTLPPETPFVETTPKQHTNLETIPEEVRPETIPEETSIPAPHPDRSSTRHTRQHPQPRVFVGHNSESLPHAVRHLGSRGNYGRHELEDMALPTVHTADEIQLNDEIDSEQIVFD